MTSRVLTWQPRLALDMRGARYAVIVFCTYAPLGSVANLRLRQPRCMIGDNGYSMAADDD